MSDGDGEAPEKMYVVRRVDGEMIDGEVQHYVTAGPEDWTPVDDGWFHEGEWGPVVYELVEFQALGRATRIIHEGHDHDECEVRECGWADVEEGDEEGDEDA